MKRWSPRIELTKQEQLIMKRLNRVRALFGFLRLNRGALFDDAFQAELEQMYRQTGAGDPPHPPAMMCMVLLLQGYVGASDAEAVELAVMDLRWQMALDCLGADEPVFSQGALQTFRERMVAHEMDRVLLERTVALVRDGVATKGEGQLLTKAVRVAIDSRPLVGVGRVEDTINLLGHAARSIVRLVSKIMGWAPEDICRKAGAPLGASPIAADIERKGFRIGEAHVDRAYINSPVITSTLEQGGKVFAKPWGQRPRRPGLFSKADFRIDLRARTVTCPAGETELFEPGSTVHFDPEACGACRLRAQCTEAASGRGRSVSIAEDEALQKKLRKLQASRSGRESLRERVAVEHSLAHVAARKGPKARYVGVRKNLFDLRRAAAIQNLEAVQRIQKAAA